MYLNEISNLNPSTDRQCTGSESPSLSAPRTEQLAALGQRSAMIAHELRNPLAALSLNLQYLSERVEIPADYERNFENIEFCVSRIQNIVESVLDFALESPPRKLPANIHSVLDSSLHEVQHEYERAGITVRKDYRAEPSRVLVDSNQMRHVFANLFLNAKDAMSSGDCLTITTASPESHLKVEIRDQGKGIPGEQIDKIFNPFFSTKPKGTGLGLAIVARILEQHRFQINVDSMLGVGTKFTINFAT